jgi:hypothetical protein
MISFRVGFTATSIIGMAICIGTLAPSLAMMSPPGGDKLQHLVAFSAFALPMVLVERQYWRLMLTLTLLLGTAIELIQPHINHSGDPMDLLAKQVESSACSSALQFPVYITRCTRAQSHCMDIHLIEGLQRYSEGEDGAGSRVAFAVCLREVGSV